MKVKIHPVLILAALLLATFDKPVSAQASSEPVSCPASAGMNIINFESAGTSFGQFQNQDNIILFFGDVDANLDTVHSQTNGQQLYCDYLKAHRQIFPSNAHLYTYPYLGPAYSIALTENGADIIASPEQTPEPGRDGIQVPDRWFGMRQLINLMTNRDPMEGASPSDQKYTVDELMAEARALAKTYIYARLWDTDKQAWKADPTEALQITVVSESFGTSFARRFLVALAERMAAVGYDEPIIQKALASVNFFAIADVVPPLSQETGSIWAPLNSIPTLSVMHADEDFARYYNAMPFYQPYVPLDSNGKFAEGVWPLVEQRYIYIKVALNQPNVHGVKPDDLANDPVWLGIWDRLQSGETLIEALNSMTKK